LQRYGDLTVFKIAAVRHLGFFEIQFFNGQSSRAYRDICDFQDGGRRHLRFSKIRNLTVIPLYVASMRHHSKFRQNASNGCRDMAI